jgi:hypothetical protein
VAPAKFDTTGYRSIAQLSSCLQQIRSITGRGDADLGTAAGIPLKLVLRPYRAQHQGQSSIQNGVSLEFRATDVVELAQMLNHHTQEFRQAVHLLPAAAGAVVSTPDPENGEDAPDPDQAATEEPARCETPDNQSAVNGHNLVDGEFGEANEAGAMSAEFYGDFPEQQSMWEPSTRERNHPILTPTERNWLESGQILGRIYTDRGFKPDKLRDLHVDVLIALTARSYGARLITSNGSDFEMINRYRPIQLEIW